MRLISHVQGLSWLQQGRGPEEPLHSTAAMAAPSGQAGLLELQHDQCKCLVACRKALTDWLLSPESLALCPSWLSLGQKCGDEALKSCHPLQSKSSAMLGQEWVAFVGCADLWHPQKQPGDHASLLAVSWQVGV